MPAGTRKVATCCYCGTRAALVLTGTDRHELACGTCGAPLHDLKAFPIAGNAKQGKLRKPKAARPVPKDGWASAPTLRKPKKKRRKSLFQKLVSELRDIVEDVID